MRFFYRCQFYVHTPIIMSSDYRNRLCSCTLAARPKPLHKTTLSYASTRLSKDCKIKTKTSHAKPELVLHFLTTNCEAWHLLQQHIFLELRIWRVGPMQNWLSSSIVIWSWFSLRHWLIPVSSSIIWNYVTACAFDFVRARGKEEHRWLLIISNKTTISEKHN